MNTLRHITLIIGMIISLQGCVSSSGGDNSNGGDLQSDASYDGYLTIGESHPTLSNAELLSFRAAQAWTTKHNLTIGGQQLNEEHLDSSRSYFGYNGFPSEARRAFELRFIGQYQGEDIELLTATGNHTFKTYAAETCKPSRENNNYCGDVQESDDTSTLIEQQLVISELSPADCDQDGVDNLTEIYFGTDPCGGISEQPQGDVAAAVADEPANNAVLERSSSYTFEFSGSADSLHTHYFVRVYNGEDGTTLVGSSNRTPVLANQSADYSVTLSASLTAGNTYNWRVFGIDAEQTTRQLSPSRIFKVANAVPSLVQTLPNNNSVENYVDAGTGHLFRFSSTTDTGVHEYRVHLTDESNHIDYGYKRIYATGNNSGGSYFTTRNLALKQGARHRWHISANDQAGNVLAQTPTREFTIETIQSIDYTLAPTSPANNATLIKVDQAIGYDFSFSSNTHTGVAEYRVHLRDTTNGDNYGYKQVFVSNTNLTQGTTRNLNLNANGMHVWYVTAHNDDGDQLAQSAERQFTVEVQASNTTLDSSDARNTATRDYNSDTVGHVFYFNSSSDTGIAEYRVYIEEIDGPNYGYKSVASSGSASGAAYQTTRNLALNSGRSHRFYVTANDIDGNEVVRTATSIFTINASTGTGATPTITRSTPGASIAWASQSIGYLFSFSVTNADDVDSYRVHVEDTDSPINFGYKEIDAAANTVGGMVSTTRNISTNSEALHQWYVTAHDAGGAVLAQSATWTFTPSVPELTSLTPTAGATVSLSASGYNFNFRSSDNTGVAEYRVHVFDIDNNDGSFGYKTELPNAATGPSDYSSFRNITLQANTLHRWRVAALDAAGIEMRTSDWQEFTSPP